MTILKAVLLALVLAAAPAEALPVLGTNIIINGDAESGAGSLSGTDILTVPGWSTNNNFTVVQYGPSFGFPDQNSPGPAARGANFFAGGPNTAASSASQSINVSAEATVIDLGSVAFTLSGFLGGFSNHGDNAALRANFLSATNQVLGTVVLGPVTPVERNNVTGLLFRTTSGFLPAGTREIGLSLDITRFIGSYNDGYADNLSLVLNGPSASVPEPNIIFLLVGAFVILARRIRC